MNGRKRMSIAVKIDTMVSIARGVKFERGILGKIDDWAHSSVRERAIPSSFVEKLCVQEKGQRSVHFHVGVRVSYLCISTCRRCARSH